MSILQFIYRLFLCMEVILDPLIPQDSMLFSDKPRKANGLVDLAMQLHSRDAHLAGMGNRNCARCAYTAYTLH